MFNSLKGLFAPTQDEESESKEEHEDLDQILLEESGESSEYVSPVPKRSGFSWLLSHESESEDSDEESDSNDSKMGDPTDLATEMEGDPHLVSQNELPASCHELCEYMRIDKSLEEIFTLGSRFSILNDAFSTENAEDPITTPMKHIFPQIDLEQKFDVNYASLLDSTSRILSKYRESGLDLGDDEGNMTKVLPLLMEEFAQKYKTLMNVSNAIVLFKRALGSFSARDEAVNIVHRLQTSQTVYYQEICPEDQEQSSVEYSIDPELVRDVMTCMAVLCFENEKYQEIVSKQETTEKQHHKDTSELITANESQLAVIYDLKTRLSTLKSKIDHLEHLPPPPPQIVYVPQVTGHSVPESHESADQILLENLKTQLETKEAENLRQKERIAGLEKTVASFEKKWTQDIDEMISSTGEFVSQQTGLTSVLSMEALKKNVISLRTRLSELENQSNQDKLKLELSEQKLSKLEREHAVLILRSHLTSEALIKIKTQINIKI